MPLTHLNSLGFEPKTKREKRKTVATLLLVITLLALGGCGPGPPGFIIVFCSPDSPRMRLALEGFRSHLKGDPLEVVCFPQFGPEGKESLRRVRGRRPRLLVALGTPALMLAAPVEKRTPVVFALVANPYFTGAAYDPAHPEVHQENVTGLVTPPPVAAALKQGAGLLGARTWGLLYDPDDGVAAEIARTFPEEARRNGLQALIETSTSADTDEAALSRLRARGARILYLPPAASAARYASRVLDLGRRLQVMVVSSLPEEEQNGAILRVFLDYRRLGEEAAALAHRVLRGEAPKKIPLAESQPLKVAVDESLLRRWSGYPGKN
jgi:ABC-type uncharacterized transport system substrate-binding protein